MSKDPDRIRADARDALATAARARELAAEIALRRRMIGDRLAPCVHAHRADVWNSRAATASRETLVHTVGRELTRAQAELGRTEAALVRHALGLEARARTDLARADELERLATWAAQMAGG
jgi:hypothetical protein